MGKSHHVSEAIPVGYARLMEMFAIEALPHYRKSYILSHGGAYSERENDKEIHYYPKKYFPGDFQDPFNQLKFAFNYDGINLEILLAVFQKLDPKVVETYINSQPTSKLSRKI